MNVTLSFETIEEAAAVFRHLGKFKFKRLRPEPVPSAPAAPEPATDHRMQAILDKFHAV